MSALTWKGTGTSVRPTGGTFGDAANWTGGVAPSSSDDAYLNAGSYVVTVSAASPVRSVSIGAGVTLDLTSGGYVLDVTGNSVNSGTIQIDGSVFGIESSASLINYGNIYGQPSSSSIAAVAGSLIENDGLISDSSGFSPGSLFVYSAVRNYGLIDTRGGGALHFGSSTFTNNAVVTANNHGRISFVGSGTHATITNLSSDGVLTGGTWSTEGSFSTLALYGAAITELGAGTTVNLVSAGSIFDVQTTANGDVVTLEASLTTVDQKATLQVLGNRDYTTSKSLTIEGTLTLRGGTFSAGSISAEKGSVIGGFGTVAANIVGYGRVVSSISSRVLSFTGQNVFYGILSGAGTVQFTAGSAEFDPGVQLSVAKVAATGGNLSFATNLTCGGVWSMSAGTVYLGGQTLTLTGTDAFSGGTLSAPGVLALKGSTTVSGTGWTLAGAMRVFNAAAVAATGDVTIEGAARFFNSTGATYSLGGAGSADIYAAAGATGAFYNQGTLQKLASTGASVIDAALVNTGAVTAAASAGLKLAGGVSGGGTISIVGAGLLEIASSVAKTQALSFASGADGTLLLDHGQVFAGTVAGFTSGDTLDFGGIASSGASVVYKANAGNTGGTLTVVGGSDRASINLDGQFLASSFHAAADASGTGTAVIYTPPAPNASHLAVAHV